MTSTTRSILSAATYIGIVPFFLVSIFLAGPLSNATSVGFALLIAYGLLGISVLSYSRPPYITLRSGR